MAADDKVEQPVVAEAAAGEPVAEAAKKLKICVRGIVSTGAGVTECSSVVAVHARADSEGEWALVGQTERAQCKGDFDFETNVELSAQDGELKFVVHDTEGDISDESVVFFVTTTVADVLKAEQTLMLETEVKDKKFLRKMKKSKPSVVVAVAVKEEVEEEPAVEEAAVEEEKEEKVEEEAVKEVVEEEAVKEVVEEPAKEEEVVEEEKVVEEAAKEVAEEAAKEVEAPKADEEAEVVEDTKLVNFSLGVRGMVGTGLLGKTEPRVELLTRVSDIEAWELQGTTEALKGKKDGDFAAALSIAQMDEEIRELKFDVYNGKKMLGFHTTTVATAIAEATENKAYVLTPAESTDKKTRKKMEKAATSLLVTLTLTDKTQEEEKVVEEEVEEEAPKEEVVEEAALEVEETPKEEEEVKEEEKVEVQVPAKPAKPAEEAPKEEEKKEEEPPVVVEKVKPSPQIFSLMRNGHEVLRGMMKDLAEASEKDTLAEFAVAWADFMLWHELHSTMEEGVKDGPIGFFQRLDIERDGVATKQGLMSAHEELEALEHAVAEALEAGDKDAVAKNYAAFAEQYESHLKDEENVMMPEVMAMKKACVPLMKVMKEDILATVTGHADFGMFVTLAMRTQEKHPSGSPDHPRCRVWIHALMTVATPEQWAEWLPHAKAGLSEEMYKQIHEEIDLETKAKPVEKPKTTPKLPTDRKPFRLHKRLETYAVDDAKHDKLAAWKRPVTLTGWYAANRAIVKELNETAAQIEAMQTLAYVPVWQRKAFAQWWARLSALLLGMQTAVETALSLMATRVKVPVKFANNNKGLAALLEAVHEPAATLGSFASELAEHDEAVKAALDAVAAAFQAYMPKKLKAVKDEQSVAVHLFYNFFAPNDEGVAELFFTTSAEKTFEYYGSLARATKPEEQKTLAKASGFNLKSTLVAWEDKYGSLLAGVLAAATLDEERPADSMKLQITADEGVECQKHGHKGKPHPVQVFCNKGVAYYCKPGPARVQDEAKSVALTQAFVRKGKHTEAFARKIANMVADDLCVSVHSDAKELSLQFADAESANLWYYSIVEATVPVALPEPEPEPDVEEKAEEAVEAAAVVEGDKAEEVVEGDKAEEVVEEPVEPKNVLKVCVRGIVSAIVGQTECNTIVALYTRADAEGEWALVGQTERAQCKGDFDFETNVELSVEEEESRELKFVVHDTEEDISDDSAVFFVTTTVADVLKAEQTLALETEKEDKKFLRKMKKSKPSVVVAVVVEEKVEEGAAVEEEKVEEKVEEEAPKEEAAKEVEVEAAVVEVPVKEEGASGEVIVDEKHFGALIGKGGANIKEIKTESGATKINFPKRQGADEPIVIEGSDEAKAKAKELILAFVKKTEDEFAAKKAAEEAQHDATAAEFDAKNAEVQRLAEEREQCYEKSRAAHEAGDGASAKEWAAKGKLAGEKMHAEKIKVEREMLNSRNKDNAETVIDLHGLHVEPAKEFVKERITMLREKGVKELKVIVGAGNHSDAAGPKIKPAVQQMLNEMSIKWAPGDSHGDIAVSL